MLTDNVESDRFFVMADVLQSTEQYAVQVAVAAPVQQLYTYTLPQGAVQVGMRVWVPWDQSRHGLGCG